MTSPAAWAVTAHSSARWRAQNFTHTLVPRRPSRQRNVPANTVLIEVDGQEVVISNMQFCSAVRAHPTCSGSGRSSVSLKGISSVNARHLHQRRATSWTIRCQPGLYCVSLSNLCSTCQGAVGTSVRQPWRCEQCALELLANSVGRDAEVRLARLINAIAPTVLRTEQPRRS